MPLESSAQTDAATDLRNGVSLKSGRRGVGPKPIASLLTRLGLRFDDPAVEDQYKALFAEHAIYRTRIAMGLAVVTNAVFGIWDLTSASGGLMSTRFRYMVAFPAFAIFFCWQLSPKHEEVVAGILGALLPCCHGLHVSFGRAL